MLDTEKLLVRFWRQAAGEFGYDMTDEDVFGIRSLSRKYSVPRLKERFGQEFPFEEVRSRRIKLMNDFIDQNGFEVKSGLFELLSYATATARDRATDYLSRIDALRYFDAVICGDMVTNGKPEPDIYITAANELGIPCGECAAFEDSPNGVLSAYRAGCQVIMIPDLTQPTADMLPMLSGVYSDLEKAIAYFEEV